MSQSNTEYTNALLEEIRSQNKAVLDLVVAVREELATVPKREEFDGLKQDVKVIRAAVTDLSQQVANHKQHISLLEAA